MKYSVLLFFMVVALGGCDSQSASTAIVGSKEMSSSKQASTPISTEETLSFIQSRIHSQVFDIDSKKLSVLQVAPVNLMNTKWTWTAHMHASDEAGSRPLYLSEAFAVMPADLAAQVRVNQNMVIVECRIGNCLKVHSSYGRADFPSTQMESDSEREKVVWLFDSTESADRVAKALNNVLPALGAKQPSY